MSIIQIVWYSLLAYGVILIAVTAFGLRVTRGRK
jgi:hypothetical protein